MSDTISRLSDAEARELWERALELQEAAERAVEARRLAKSGEEGLKLEHVAQAAEAAGINPDFVLLALAERQLPDGADIRRDDWRAKWLRRAVSDLDAIEATRRIEASPERVLEALHEVSTRPAFDLALESVVGPGEDPTEQVLVYRRQGAAWSRFSGNMEAADARVLLFAVRSLAGGCQLRVRVPMFRRGLNLGLAGVVAGVLGAAGSWSAWSLGALVAAGVGGAALAVPAGIGALAGGAIGLSGFRAFYERMARHGETGLYDLLNTIAAEAEGRTHPLISSRGGRS